MWGIYLTEIEQIVQDYDQSWQKTLDGLYAENSSVVKIREFIEKNRENNSFDELSYADFMFIASLLVVPCQHAVLSALRHRFNQGGQLDATEKLMTLGLANEENLSLISRLLHDDVKIFNAILAELSAVEISLSTPVIEFICRHSHGAIYIKPCLLLLLEYHLADAETFAILNQRSDDFSFIYLALNALATLQQGRLVTKTHFNFILDGDNSILLSKLLPVFFSADFFDEQTLRLLGDNGVHADRISAIFRFLLTHDCLDKSIFQCLITADISFAYHVEFIASLLQGCDLMNKCNVQQIFLLPNDYYLRANLAKIAEEGLLTNLLFQQTVESHTPEATILFDSPATYPMKRTQSCDEVSFFKTASEPSEITDYQSLRQSR